MGFPHQKVQENRSKGFKFLLRLLFLATSSFFLPSLYFSILKWKRKLKHDLPKLSMKQPPLSEQSKLVGRGPSAAFMASAVTVSEPAAQQARRDSKRLRSQQLLRSLGREARLDACVPWQKARAQSDSLWQLNPAKLQHSDRD